jgi:hypothetical protein
VSQETETHEGLIPLSHLSLDPDVWPRRSVGEWARFLDGEVFEDEFGRKAITAATARDIADEHRAQRAQMAADAERLAAELAARQPPAPKGVPAIEGLSSLETLMAQPTFVSLSDEFGRPRPNFLDDELAAGKRHVAEQQAKAKERAVKKMKEDLS